MLGRYEVDVFVDGKMYRINEEVEVEEEGNQDWGGKIIKIVEEGNQQWVGGGKSSKLWRRREFKNEEGK